MVTHVGSFSCETPFELDSGLCKHCRRRVDPETGQLCNRLVGHSAAMHELLIRVATVANTDASVVLTGPSGSGKEVVARALHANSARRLKPFVAVNCAALPAELLESELFGHARGAFTGAQTARKGLFETADGGTLLLDEIAELPMALQAKLLRCLQDGEVRRVGESTPIHVDVRVLCATHQNLQQCVRERRFREDLYFRLKVFTLMVPALCERKEDIVPLAQMFLRQEGHKRGFSSSTLVALQEYRWPGNVRELMNAVKHGAVLSRGREVELEHLPDELSGKEPSPTPDSDGLVTLAEAERRHIERVLVACGGQQQDTARVLGIGRTTLWRKLMSYGLTEASESRHLASARPVTAAKA